MLRFRIIIQKEYDFTKNDEFYQHDRHFSIT